VLLIVQSIVSFRSVPRILELLKDEIGLSLSWIPHFTSVINWTLRLGLGLLKQVKPINQPWLAIVDHSIDIGTKKVLVVLRVAMSALPTRGGAIRLEDCECVGLRISEHVTGETVAEDLDAIFIQSGAPKAIIKDRDYTLHKGVKLWTEKQERAVPVIHDIGHAMANALEAQFENNGTFQRFVALISRGASRLRQTECAFLIPPKLRSKGRFQSISTLGKWAEKVLNVLSAKDRAQPESVTAKLRKALPGFRRFKPFIQRFASTTHAVSRVLEILKNQGLDKASFEQCCQICQSFPRNSKVKKRLQSWLNRHIEIKTHLTDLPLLVSSDIIESLFGSFKHIIERSPQADMNRTALLIPALCGRLTKAAIDLAMAQTRHDDLKLWEQENIPYTVRKQRRAFFAHSNIQKPCKLLLKFGG
jgi:hypothetical protein